MPLAAEVRLPRDHVPVFPDRCCACGRPRPGDVLPVARRRAAPWELLLPWVWFLRRPFRCAAPFCPPCRSDALRQRRIRLLALVAVVVAAAVVLGPWIKSFGWNRQWTRLLQLGSLAAIVLPIGMWWAIRPPVFDITVTRDGIDYEFRDADYARDFAAANR